MESRYVTLDEIAEMIKAGAEVKIIDNRTKDDLTSVTLAQIIFEEEKKTSKMSLETLRDLIRHGGEVAQRLVEGTQAELRGRVEAVRAAAEQRVQHLITRGQATSDRAKELVQTSQEAMAAMQRKVDERVRSAVEGMSEPRRGPAAARRDHPAARASSSGGSRSSRRSRRGDPVAEAGGASRRPRPGRSRLPPLARRRPRRISSPIAASAAAPDERGACSNTVRPWLWASSTFTDQPSTVRESSSGNRSRSFARISSASCVLR